MASAIEPGGQTNRKEAPFEVSHQWRRDCITGPKIKVCGILYKIYDLIYYAFYYNVHADLLLKPDI